MSLGLSKNRCLFYLYIINIVAGIFSDVKGCILGVEDMSCTVGYIGCTIF